MDELHTIQDSSDGGAVLATFHYRPKLWVILGCGLMGGAGLGVAYARWAESGGFADITLGLASAAFVLLALLLGGMRTFAPQTVVVRERGLQHKLRTTLGVAPEVDTLPQGWARHRSRPQA